MLLFLAACAGPAPLQLGATAPDFTLRDAAMNAYTLSEQRGAVVVVDLSAMWCPTCQRLAPQTQALADTHAADGLVVWSVLFQNTDGDSPSAGDLEAWSAEFGLTHPVLADDDEQVYADYGAGVQPAVFVVDAEGAIAWMGEGGDAAAGLSAAVQDAL